MALALQAISKEINVYNATTKAEKSNCVVLRKLLHIVTDFVESKPLGFTHLQRIHIFTVENLELIKIV
jgi:hypothetical protein